MSVDHEEASDAAPHTILLGSGVPVARLLIDACARQVRSSEYVDLECASVDAPSWSARKTRIIAVLTWQDLLRVPLDDALCSLAARLARTLAGGVSGDVMVCFVPYASCGDGEGNWFRWLTPAPLDQGQAEQIVRRALAALRQRVAGVRFVVSPMMIGAQPEQDYGYLSLLEKTIRAARCVGDEIEDKAPGFVARYGLGIQTDAPAFINALTPWGIARSILAATCTNESPMPRADALGGGIGWAELAAVLTSRTALAASSSTSGVNGTAADDVLREIALFHGDYYLSPAVAAAPLAVRVADRDAALGNLVAMAALAPAAWESSYHSTTDDVVDVDGPDPEAWDHPGSPDESLLSFAGRHGPVVVVILPLAIAPAYFSKVTRRLRSNHRIMVWQSLAPAAVEKPSTMARANAELLGKALRDRHVDECHVIAWCGAARVAAALVQRRTPQVTSLTLIAPDICEPSQRTPSSQRLAAILARAHHNRGLAEHVRLQLLNIRDARRTIDLDQYAPSSTVRRSPFQYRPMRLAKSLAEEMAADEAGMLAVARDVAESGEAQADVAATLVAYRGPVLVVVGTDDFLISDAAVRARYAALGSCHIATVIGGNHWLVLEHGDAVGRLCERFISGAPIEKAESRITATRIRLELIGHPALAN